MTSSGVSMLEDTGLEEPRAPLKAMAAAAMMGKLTPSQRARGKCLLCGQDLKKGGLSPTSPATVVASCHQCFVDWVMV